MANPKILIIDDEELILTTLNADLSDNGYDITTVTNGEKDLKKLEKSKFDLLITDLSLEGMNGIEVLCVW